MPPMLMESLKEIRDQDEKPSFEDDPKEMEAECDVLDQRGGPKKGRTTTRSNTPKTILLITTTNPPIRPQEARQDPRRPSLGPCLDDCADRDVLISDHRGAE